MSTLFPCSFPDCGYIAIHDVIPDVPHAGATGDPALVRYCAMHWAMYWRFMTLRQEIRQKRRGDWYFTEHRADNLACGDVLNEVREIVRTFGADFL